ncbi:MAG: hypothetical protein ACTTKY_08990 [Catonella sp.]
MNLRFESFVNSEWCKTKLDGLKAKHEFESFVNSEWCKTIILSFSLASRYIRLSCGKVRMK